VFKAALAAGGVVQAAVLVALIFVGGALSFVYMFQAYQRDFLSQEPQGGYWEKAGPLTGRVLVASLAALVLVAGLWPEPLLVLGEAAAAALAGNSGGGH